MLFLRPRWLRKMDRSPNSCFRETTEVDLEDFAGKVNPLATDFARLS